VRLAMTLKHAGSTRLPGLCLAGLLCVFNTQSMAGALYKWVDENGAVRYSDQLPPKQNPKGHQKLNPQGLVVTTKEAAKSPEEIAIEAEALQQQREEVRLKALQKRQDRVLLLTFSSEQEIEHARENRLESIDSVIRLIQNSVKSTQGQLDHFTNHAQLNYTSKGKEIPGGLAQKIEHYQRKIERRNVQLESKEVEKDKISAKYNQDLERFQRLKSASN